MKPTFSPNESTAASGRILCLAGPTASGKSAVALHLAERLNGEVVSVDSMQVYRGLDIGTAKPAREERRNIPHHLIDVANLDESFDAAKFVKMAEVVVKDITVRRRLPIFCGGTGLYFKAWMEGLGSSPSSNPALRQELESTPIHQLLGDLEKLDPITFEKIDKLNPRRVIRAMEVIRLTGKPYSAQRASWSENTASPQNDSSLYVLKRDPADLRARINDRVDKMFAAGLVDETQRLLHQNLAQNPTAMQAIGYRQVVEHLRGERPLPETIQLIKTKTWQYSKRQMTWFKYQANPIWIDCAAGESAELAASRIIEHWNSQPNALPQPQHFE